MVNSFTPHADNVSLPFASIPITPLPLGVLAILSFHALALYIIVV
jgi:hypothetical protein